MGNKAGEPVDITVECLYYSLQPLGDTVGLSIMGYGGPVPDSPVGGSIPCVIQVPGRGMIVGLERRSEIRGRKVASFEQASSGSCSWASKE